MNTAEMVFQGRVCPTACLAMVVIRSYDLMSYEDGGHQRRMWCARVREFMCGLGYLT